MDLAKLAGLGLIVGALIFMVAAIPMPSIYGIQDADERLAKIRADEGGFLLSHSLFALGASVVAAGFALLAVWLAGRGEPLLPGLGAVAIAVGAGLWVYFMYDRATNPEVYFRDYEHVPAYVWVSALATAIGLVTFGYLLLEVDVPGWVGYLTFVVVALTILAAVVAPQIVPPQLLYLPPLVMGAVLLLSGIPA